MRLSSRYAAYVLGATAFFAIAVFAAAGEPATRDYLLVKDLPFINEGAGLDNYLQGLFKLGTGIAITLAVLMLVWAGFQYMLSDIPAIKTNAKGTMQNAIWGLVLVFSTYLILYTINPNLVEFDLLNTLDEAAKFAAKDNVKPPPGGNEDDIKRPWKDDSAERSLLNGIAINKANCKNIGDTNCTSVAGLDRNAIEKLLNLKQKCNCSITITGGTEHWLHSTHTNNRTVDLSASGISSYLGGTGTRCGVPTVTKDGITFRWEDSSCSWDVSGPHWHVSL